MIRALVLLIALLLCALLLTLAHRVEDQPEQLVTHSTSTTLGSNGPELAFNEDFGRLVDAAKVARSGPSRTAPNKRAAKVVAGAVPDIIRRVFARFGAQVAEQAVRVSSCETGGTFNPAARNGQHLGIFQISRTYHEARVRRLGFSWSDMAQAEPNALVAADIFSESGWGPWTCRWAAA